MATATAAKKKGKSGGKSKSNGKAASRPARTAPQRPGPIKPMRRKSSRLRMPERREKLPDAPGRDKTKPACCWCNGVGNEPPLPDLAGITQAKLAAISGISPALISRLISDLPSQKRPNPTLYTLRALQTGLHAELGVRLPLDIIAGLIDG